MSPLFLISFQEATIASQLLVAVRTRNLNAMRRLCSVRSERLTAALKRRDGQGHTLMHWAAKSGDVEMLQVLAGAWYAIRIWTVTTAYSQQVLGYAIRAAATACS